MSTIRYWEPVQSAWDKMVAVLFRPFDLGKWMVIGFTAFLAQCGREGGGGGNGSTSSNHSSGGGDLEETFSEIGAFLSDAWAEYAGLIILCSVLLILLMIGLTLLTNWLNSRGQFMLLDNVVKNRAAVEEPWGEYRKEANSLMWFQILIGVVSLVLILPIVIGIIVSIYPMVVQERVFAANLFGILILILLFIVLSLVFWFIQMVLSNFVVPLMYQRRISVMEGVRAFRPIFKQYFWHLVLFGLVLWVVQIVVGMALLIGVLLTCCTAFLILVIPYIGTVALLPVYVFYRFIGPEFMRQFGDEYDLLDDSLYPPKTIPPMVSGDNEDVPKSLPSDTSDC